MQHVSDNQIISSFVSHVGPIHNGAVILSSKGPLCLIGKVLVLHCHSYIILYALLWLLKKGYNIVSACSAETDNLSSGAFELFDVASYSKQHTQNNYTCLSCALPEGV